MIFLHKSSLYYVYVPSFSSASPYRRSFFLFVPINWQRSFPVTIWTCQKRRPCLRRPLFGWRKTPHADKALRRSVINHIDLFPNSASSLWTFCNAVTIDIEDAKFLRTLQHDMKSHSATSYLKQIQHITSNNRSKMWKYAIYSTSLQCYKPAALKFEFLCSAERSWHEVSFCGSHVFTWYEFTGQSSPNSKTFVYELEFLVFSIDMHMSGSQWNRKCIVTDPLIRNHLWLVYIWTV